MIFQLRKDEPRGAWFSQLKKKRKKEKVNQNDQTVNRS